MIRTVAIAYPRGVPRIRRRRGRIDGACRPAPSWPALLVSLEGARRLSFDADVLSLLPHDNRVIQAFRTFRGDSAASISFTSSHCAGGPRHQRIQDEIATGWTACGARRSSRASMLGVVDRSRDFGWLADHQLLVKLISRLDEALRRLTLDGMRARVRRAARAAHDSRRRCARPLCVRIQRGSSDLVRDALGGAQVRLSVMGISADDARMAAAAW